MSSIDGAVARRRGFSGAVSLSLADIVQMHALARFTGTLRFTNGDDQANLYFTLGDIVDAECGGLRGAEAVYASLAWQGGGFVARPGEVSRERTISENWQSVLMEGCRRLDEGGRDQPPAEASGGVERRVGPGDGTSSPGRGREHADGVDVDNAGKGREQMATEKEILETFNKIESEVGGFIACSLVDLESGMTLAVRSVRGDFDLAAASAYNSEMVKQKLKTIKALNLRSTLDDVLLTLSDQIHFIKMVTPRTFLYMAADKNATNLAIVRSSVLKYVAALA
jgi:hypothetical protein